MLEPTSGVPWLLSKAAFSLPPLPLHVTVEFSDVSTDFIKGGFQLLRIFAMFSLFLFFFCHSPVQLTAASLSGWGGISTIILFFFNSLLRSSFAVLLLQLVAPPSAHLSFLFFSNVVVLSLFLDRLYLFRHKEYPQELKHAR